MQKLFKKISNAGNAFSKNANFSSSYTLNSSLSPFGITLEQLIARETNSPLNAGIKSTHTRKNNNTNNFLTDDSDSESDMDDHDSMRLVPTIMKEFVKFLSTPQGNAFICCYFIFYFIFFTHDQTC